MVMKPRDAIDFTKHNYSTPKTLEIWNRTGYLERGLNADEMLYLEKIPEKKGKLLLLGLGGGREAVPLAEMGFDVTGIDFVPAMVEKAMEFASKKGVRISGLVQDISNLDIPDSSYDVVWLSSYTYSLIPTRTGRIGLLKKIQSSLIPGGYFISEFMWKKAPEYPAAVRLARKLFAILTLGNFSFEEGDLLWDNEQFIHVFFSESTVRAEFEEAGFDIIEMFIQRESLKGGTVLRKKN